jgi:dynein light chain 1
LKQLWISYNEIEKLDSVKNLVNLEVFYVGNNNISKIDELNYLTGLGNLIDVVFKGNLFYPKEEKDKGEIYAEIKKRIPSVTIIDGDLLK